MQTKTFLSLLAGLLFCSSVFASHYSAGFLTYRYIGDSTGTAHEYLVELTIFRDINGVTLGTRNESLDIQSSCFTNFTSTLQYQPPTNPHPQDQHGGDVNPILNCAGTANYSLYRYKTVVVLPSACNDIRFITNLPCCRASNDNLQNGGGDVQFFADLDNSIAENNLPKPIAASLLPSLCVGNFASFGNYQADPDSSAGYFIAANPIQTGNGGVVVNSNFISPFTVSQPLPTDSNGYTVDSLSGKISFNPTTAGTYVLALEYFDHELDTVTNTLYTAGKIHMEIIADIQANCSATILTGPSISRASGPDSLDLSCGDTAFFVQYPADLDTSSISSDFSEFRVAYLTRNQVVPVKRVEIFNDDSLLIILQDSLDANAVLTFTTHIGNDGNGLLNYCQFDQQKFDTINYIVSGCSGIGLPQQYLFELELYPNPSCGEINLGYAGEPLREIRLINQQGQVLKSWHNNPRKLMLNGFAPGIYFLQMTNSEGEVLRRKIMLE